MTALLMSLFLAPILYAENKVEQAASTVFQVFGMSRPGIESRSSSNVRLTHCTTQPVRVKYVRIAYTYN